MIITIYGGSKKTRKQREKEKQAWKAQQEKYKISSVKSGKAWTPEVVNSINSRLSLNSHRLNSNFPSKDSGIGNASKKEVNVYTGDKMIGIGNLHKSNLVPVFKDEEAKDLASMRR
jgi:hypothetical protein